MSWTTPKTWVTGEVVTAAHMNTYISDNLSHLMTAAGGQADTVVGTSYSTSSTSYVDIDTLNLSVTLTLSRPRVLVFISGAFTAAASTAGYITISNGVTDLGTLFYVNNGSGMCASLGVFIVLPVGATCTFRPQWKIVGTGPFSLAAPKVINFAAMEI